MFGPEVLEEFDSPFGGRIRLMQGWGYKYVATGILTQSGGVIEDVWRPLLKKIGQKNKTWLILGLGAGTVAHMISKKYSPKAIVGVEIDPIMLDLGRRHFDLNAIPNLDIIQGDASQPSNWKTVQLRNFDYILVDLYLGDQLPKFVYARPFLRRLRQLGQTVVFNHLFYDAAKRQAAEGLVAATQQIFTSVTLVRSLTNVLIVCS